MNNITDIRSRQPMQSTAPVPDERVDTLVQAVRDLLTALDKHQMYIVDTVGGHVTSKGHLDAIREALDAIEGQP